MEQDLLMESATTALKIAKNVLKEFVLRDTALMDLRETNKDSARSHAETSPFSVMSAMKESAPLASLDSSGMKTSKTVFLTAIEGSITMTMFAKFVSITVLTATITLEIVMSASAKLLQETTSPWFQMDKIVQSPCVLRIA